MPASRVTGSTTACSLEHGETTLGIVVRAHGLYFDVQVPSGAILRCTVRGALKRQRLRTDLVAPGDRVTVRATHPGEGVIEVVAPRQRTLSRLARGRDDVEQVILANPDQVAVIFSVREPVPSFRMLDRFLVITEDRELPAFIVANKVDLDPTGVFRAPFEVYEQAGYPVVYASASTGDGLDLLRELLRDRITILVGPSGVGKTSLLNALRPGLGEATRAVSRATGKGRHTTTATRLFSVSGGYVADSPGLRTLEFWDVEPENLDLAFREFRPYLTRCRFTNCAHITEPDCAVKAAVERGEISPERYDSYVRLRSGEAVW